MDAASNDSQGVYEGRVSSYPLRYTYRENSTHGENRVEVPSRGIIQRNGAFDVTIIGGKRKILEERSK